MATEKTVAQVESLLADASLSGLLEAVIAVCDKYAAPANPGYAEASAALAPVLADLRRQQDDVLSQFFGPARQQ